MADSGSASKAVASREENFKATPGDGSSANGAADTALMSDESPEGGSPENPEGALPDRS